MALGKAESLAAEGRGVYNKVGEARGAAPSVLFAEPRALGPADLSSIARSQFLT